MPKNISITVCIFLCHKVSLFNVHFRTLDVTITLFKSAIAIACSCNFGFVSLKYIINNSNLSNVIPLKIKIHSHYSNVSQIVNIGEFHLLIY